MNALAGLAGARVLITGASSGVGEAAARRFSAEGAAVALLARRADRLTQLAEELGDGAYPHPADITDPAAVAVAVGAADAALGGLDLVVNAAGIAEPLALEQLDAEPWRRMLDVNLSGTFYVAREAALRMRGNGGGTIVNIGSDLASKGLPEFAHYCAAKAGVVALTKALALELAPDVRVNVVCPGPIDTPMLAQEHADTGEPEAARRETTAGVPLRRIAAPEEIVAAVRFLAVEAPNATGAVIPLDGGTTAI